MLLGEIINICTLIGGYFFDTFSGTLTTAIAALGTSRHCVCVERDEICFDLAIGRFANFSKSFSSLDADAMKIVQHSPKQSHFLKQGKSYARRRKLRTAMKMKMIQTSLLVSKTLKIFLISVSNDALSLLPNFSLVVQ